MSLISDALNKAQQDRAEQIAFGTYAAGAYSRRHKPAVQVKSVTFVWANAAILTVFFAVALLYMRNRPERAAVASSPASVAAVEAKPTPALALSPATPVESPFRAASAPVPSDAVAPSKSYDLAGMTMMGQNTLLSISRRSDKRSVWVPIGKSVGEITAVSYDPDQDSAVIRVNGRLQTIAMRDGSLPAE